MINKNKTILITMCALFAALLAVCSQIQIPLEFIPINLALFVVYLAGIILGPWAGASSVSVFVLLGVAGVPVFAGFKGGLGAITGPTGGYIVGYIFAALVTGFVVRITNDKIYMMIIACVVGMAVCYILGTVWFIILTKMSVAKAISLCVVPFLPGDAIKIVLAAVTGNRLKKLMPELSELSRSVN